MRRALRLSGSHAPMQRPVYARRITIPGDKNRSLTARDATNGAASRTPRKQRDKIVDVRYSPPTFMPPSKRRINAFASVQIVK
jgi:hypothetical protein